MNINQFKEKQSKAFIDLYYRPEDAETFGAFFVYKENGKYFYVEYEASHYGDINENAIYETEVKPAIIDGHRTFKVINEKENNRLLITIYPNLRHYTYVLENETKNPYYHMGLTELSLKYAKAIKESTVNLREAHLWDKEFIYKDNNQYFYVSYNLDVFMKDPDCETIFETEVIKETVNGTVQFKYADADFGNYVDLVDWKDVG